ncbi:MAG TPA: hypothetical protein VJW73_11345 [Gemmatimonadaceae bacterium]|nr:hypothetical protein [Gemmatimonadaceae bacterium]
MRSVLIRTVALLVLPVLASCGGSDCCSPPSNGDGHFTASVTGAKTASLAGQAGFLTSANLFSIALRDASSPATFIQISHIGAALPAPGTYSLNPNGDPAQAFAVIYSGGGTDNYAGTGGTLTLTAVSGTSVSGNFTFTGTGGSSGAAAVSVTGHFDATPLTAH